METGKALNHLKTCLFAALLGACGGLVVYGFLSAVSLCVSLIWGHLPVPWLPVPLCAAGGLLLGLLHRKYGTYPEELPVVLGKLKVRKHYSYHPMGIMLLSAFLPLVLGASVGPEAGLTGIIAGLCCWVGDNVRYAKEQEEIYSQLGAAVTLGSLFAMPLFGIFALEEPEGWKPGTLAKPWKILLYGIATFAGFGIMKVLGRIFGEASEGFPRFAAVTVSGKDLAAALLYLLAGLLLYFLFALAEEYLGKAAEKVPDLVREVICGLAIGITALLAPPLLFSGETQMAALTSAFTDYAPGVLLLAGLGKAVLTAFCIRFGFRGGHFFPLIFSGSLTGFGLAMLLFADPAPHVVFAAAIVTAAALGAQLKRPLAVSMLLLLCFPAKALLGIFPAAFLAGRAVQKRREK